RCLVDDGLGLELRMVPRIDARAGDPKITTEANNRQGRLLARGIYKHKGPVARSALGIVTQVPNRVAGDQISNSNESANHLCNRPVYECTRGPYPNIADTHTQPVVQPLAGDVTDQRPTGWLPTADRVTRIGEFRDGIVHHLQRTGDCRCDYRLRMGNAGYAAAVGAIRRERRN